MSGYEDAAESIEQGTQEIVRGYPLAAGLTSVTDGELAVYETGTDWRRLGVKLGDCRPHTRRVQQLIK